MARRTRIRGKHKLSTKRRPSQEGSAQKESRQSLRTTASFESGEDRIPSGPFRNLLSDKDFRTQLQGRPEVRFCRLCSSVVTDSHLLSPVLSHWDKRVLSATKRRGPPSHVLITWSGPLHTPLAQEVPIWPLILLVFVWTRR
jgi:hypothetical protein